jgi:hypothetical protein
MCPRVRGLFKQESRGGGCKGFGWAVRHEIFHCVFCGFGIGTPHFNARKDTAEQSHVIDLRAAGRRILLPLTCWLLTAT